MECPYHCSMLSSCLFFFCVLRIVKLMQCTAGDLVCWATLHYTFIKHKIMHIKSLGLSRYAAHNGRETLLAFTHTTHWWNSDRHIKKKLTHQKCELKNWKWSRTEKRTKRPTHILALKSVQFSSNSFTLRRLPIRMFQEEPQWIYVKHDASRVNRNKATFLCFVCVCKAHTRALKWKIVYCF